MSAAIVRIATTISNLILKIRWLLAAMISLMVLLIEIEEHRPLDANALDRNFLIDTTVFGFILPSLTGLLLSLLSYTEKERAKAVHSLDQLNLLAQELNTTSKLDEMIEKIVAFPRSIAPTNNTSLHMYNPEFDRFELISDWSIDRTSRSTLCPILTQEICQSCEVNPPGPDPKTGLVLCKQLNGLNQDIDRYCLPLIHHEHTVALLHMDFPKGMTVSSGQVRVLNSVAHEMALAIVGARQQETFDIKEEATEAERKRIAQNLHDTLGQNISVLRLKLDQLTGDDVLLEISMIRQELELMREIAEDAYQQVRGTLADLNRSGIIDLRTTLLEHAQSIGRRAGFEVNLSEQGQPLPLLPSYERQILFIVREAINNIEKHTRANYVEIELHWSETDLTIYVRDDGGGFDISDQTPSGHYGLEIMKERAEDIHGCLTIESLAGLGTQVKLWLPIVQREPKTAV